MGVMCWPPSLNEANLSDATAGSWKDLADFPLQGSLSQMKRICSKKSSLALRQEAQVQYKECGCRQLSKCAVCLPLAEKGRINESSKISICIHVCTLHKAQAAAVLVVLVIRINIPHLFCCSAVDLVLLSLISNILLLSFLPLYPDYTPPTISLRHFGLFLCHNAIVLHRIFQVFFFICKFLQCLRKARPWRSGLLFMPSSIFISSRCPNGACQSH